MGLMAESALTDLERELLERISIGGAHFGVSLDHLDEELLESSPGRPAVETALQELLDRDLVRSESSPTTSLLTLRPRDGIHPLSEAGKRKAISRDYDGDWWIITDVGRAAIGLPPPQGGAIWINPSTGPFRVPPVLAPWCTWRFRRGKQPLPDWYTRLTGKTTGGKRGR
jgi:hypothetical protein